MSGQFKIWKWFTLFFLWQIVCLGAEVDSFTFRFENKKDTTEALNVHTNDRFQHAIDQTNRPTRPDIDVPIGKRAERRKILQEQLGDYFTGEATLLGEKANPKSCNEYLLYRNIIYTLGGWGSSAVESLQYKFDDISYVPSPVVADSIYKDTAISKYYIAANYGFAPTVKLGENVVGTDKLGHFIHSGYEYFEKAVLEKEGMKTALDVVSRHIAVDSKKTGVEGAFAMGDLQEKGSWGLKYNGVYSYGDLAANYSGLQFWMGFARGPSPYVKCVDGKWVQVKKFNWADWVKPSWDEAINCSTYNSEEIEKKIEKNEREAMLKAGQPPRSCPISPDTCIGLKNEYGELAPKLLGPKCLNPSPIRANDNTNSGVLEEGTK